MQLARSPILVKALIGAINEWMNAVYTYRVSCKARRPKIVAEDREWVCDCAVLGEETVRRFGKRTQWWGSGNSSDHSKSLYIFSALLETITWAILNQKNLLIRGGLNRMPKVLPKRCVDKGLIVTDAVQYEPCHRIQCRSHCVGSQKRKQCAVRQFLYNCNYIHYSLYIASVMRPYTRTKTWTYIESVMAACRNMHQPYGRTIQLDALGLVRQA